MSASPTARTLQHCKKIGWRAGVVEKWIVQTKQRKDLYGFIDLIVLDDDTGCLGIQATATGSMSSRLHKSMEETEAALRDWLSHDNRFEVWGWAKRGKVGKRKLWTLRRIKVELDRYGGFCSHEIAAGE